MTLTVYQLTHYPGMGYQGAVNHVCSPDQVKGMRPSNHTEIDDTPVVSYISVIWGRSYHSSHSTQILLVGRHFIPRQEGTKALVYFPFQVKHLTDHMKIMIIKQLLVIMNCKLQLICLDMLHALLTPLFVLT